ncbi:small-subunit processome [Melampsora americana]|nr:small-subunit processome [Melampsora americana]
MARYKLDVQKRQHRERAQPLQRARLGLLEKHQDYVKRARDYHSKQDRIKKLREKASMKNPDEFYFEMIKSSTEKGVHVRSRGNKALDNDLVTLLKTQDFNYVKTCRAIEEKKVNKIREQLGSMVNVISPDDDELDEIRHEILKFIHQDTTAISAENREEDGSDEEDHSLLPISGKKTIFVDSVEEVRNFEQIQNKKRKSSISQSQRNLPVASTSASSSSTRSVKHKSSSTSTEDTKIDLAEQKLESERHMRKLLSNLKSRLARLRTLQKAERELELKRALMGNGSKFLKNSVHKKKVLPSGRDLSWYDKLDRNDLIEEQDEKERLAKLNEGIKTGATVWVSFLID